MMRDITRTPEFSETENRSTRRAAKARARQQERRERRQAKQKTRAALMRGESHKAEGE